MKKVLPLLLLIFILSACAFKSYPGEEVKIGDYNLGSTIKAEVETELFLPLSGLKEDTIVKTLIDDEEASLISDDVMYLNFTELIKKDIKLILSSPEYKETEFHIYLESTPHPLDAEMEERDLTFPSGQKSFTLKVKADRENAVFTVLPEGFGEFIPREAETGTKGDIVFYLPEEGAREYEIRAHAPNSDQISSKITAEVLPLLEIGASCNGLDLYRHQKANINLFPKEEGTEISYSVTTGDASLSFKDNVLYINDLSQPSIIHIEGKKEGFYPFQKDIYINIKRPPYNEQTPNQTISTKKYAKILDGIFEETNKARKEHGLPPLERVKAADTPAMIRAKEADKVWSHTRPDGRDCFTVHEDVGLEFMAMGENLFSANKYLNPHYVVNEWMNSESHRANILQSVFKGIGLGYYEGEEYTVWCQLFVA